MTRLAIAAMLFTVGCSSDTVPPPECGDGVIDGDEECDDGNTARGDGCFECRIAPMVCGNGVLDVNEQCDDSNVLPGDGCSETCEQEIPERFITASWTFKDLEGDVTTGCPVGVAEVALDVIPMEGDIVTTTFACADGMGVTPAVGPGQYRVQLRALEGQNVYAISLPEIVDVSLGDGTFDTTIYNDAGYFRFDWTLRGEFSLMVLACSQVGAASVRANITGPVTIASVFPCADGVAITQPLPFGTYAISWDLLGPAQNVMGTFMGFENLAITNANAVSLIGPIEIIVLGF